jgi:5'-deoxynucleotidase YfbR-like HD superfamily hydrolase
MTSPAQQPKTAINTRSGRVLDFADPSPESIAIEDVASGLAMAPRFGGQALRFHSVAQHAVNVSILVGHLGRPDLDLEALHHDSHEAYACDLPRPLKLVLGDPYKEVTARLDHAIAVVFGFDPVEAGSSEYKTIKAADDALFVIEAADLLEGEPIEPKVELDVLKQARVVAGTRDPWDHELARENFLRLHESCLRSRR